MINTILLLTWLDHQRGLNVSLVKGLFTYQGMLRKGVSSDQNVWEIRFHEFTMEQISSYGYDQNGQPYIVVTGETE